MINQIFTLRALSPVHCGVGQGLNDIDLPTARNVVSGHPIVPGSSLKGVLKYEFKNLSEEQFSEKYRAEKDDYIKALFGGDSSSDFASAISVGDANLLALPVRSFYGTFAYLASPYTLQNLKKLLIRSGSTMELVDIPEVGLDSNSSLYKVLLSSNSLLKPKGGRNILLEELDLLAEDNDIAEKWAEVIAKLFFSDEEGQKLFKKRFAIVDDNALNFLCTSALPVDARISIDEETGTVKGGALWYEETVPAETLFTGIIGVDRSCTCDKSAEELKGFLTEDKQIHCQVGGKSTTGKGFVTVTFGNKE